MKSISKLFCLVCLAVGLFSYNIFSQSIEIRSLQTYTAKDQASLPVIIPTARNQNYLTIEFDVKTDYTPNFIIVFRFCDKNWNPYQNIFLANNGKNIAYNLQYSTLPNTVQPEAHYHYHGTFPDSKGYVNFPFSGKWQYYITDSQDTSKVYGSGKFFVIYDTLKMNVSIKKEQLEDKVYRPPDLAKIFNVTAEFNLNDELFPSNVDEMQIVDNHKISEPIIVDRTFNTNVRQYYWDGNRKFTFTARDILPGNEYREVNNLNHNKFNSSNVNAQIDGLENSRFYTLGPRDLNGGSRLMDFWNVYATYLNVKFSIRTPDDFVGDVFLVGAFNNWVVDPKYKMTNNYGAYSLVVPLKRGIYDYQYVTGYEDSGKITDENWVLFGR